MKKAALFLLAGGMVLSGCNYDAGLGGNSSVYENGGIGVSVGDAGSVETAVRTEQEGKVSWKVEPGKGVIFTFMTRPGADEAYIKGYKITSLKRRVNKVGSNFVEQISGSPKEVKKMNLYLTSGYNCSGRTALKSCVPGAKGTTLGNGEPAQHSIYLENGLGDLVVQNKVGISQVAEVEFFGDTLNGKEFTVKATGIISSGSLQSK